MTHAEMNELYELYALGILEPERAAELETHLRDDCPYCIEHVRRAFEITAALAGLADPQTPPKQLRNRVLAAVRPEKRSPVWTLAVAGLSAACIVLAIFLGLTASRIHGMDDQIQALRSERNQLRLAIEALSRPDTRTAGFGGTNDLPHGRVFVNRDGLVFVGSQLPHLASDRTFELWLIPKAGAPQPAGLFRPSPTGNSVHVTSLPVALTQTAAVAVSVEPSQGSSTPSTKPILVIPIG